MAQHHIGLSSHSYHNCKIPFLYEHIMTPFMTRRRRRLLIRIIHLNTRIYHAYCLLHQSSSPPFAFRINQGRLVPVSPSLVRDLPSFCDPFYKPKVLYRPVTLLPSMGPFRLHAVYHVPSDSRFCLGCTNTSYVTLGFFILFTSTAWTSSYFLPLSYLKWLWSLFLVIMRVSTLGLVFCFTLA